MKNLVCNLLDIERKSYERITIHTTLYDLIAAISEEVGPGEEGLATATVVHLLNTRRVTCTEQPLKGYRIVCNGREPLAVSGQRRHDHMSLRDVTLVSTGGQA
jgi:hypothetical protein